MLVDALQGRLGRAQTGLMLCTIVIGSLHLTGCGKQDGLGPTANVERAGEIREAFVAAVPADVADVEVTTGTSWGTLRGTFTYDGTPPTMEPYSVNRDLEACTIDGRAPPQETLVVDEETRGIANIAIYVRSVSRIHESVEPDDEPVVFDQKVCVFLDHVFAVIVGQTVELKNSDPVGHNTNIEGSINQTIPAHASIQYVPQREQAYPVSVRCSIHPWMLAYFLPRANGYFAVTAEDGSFEIPNLPDGEELEFQVWHESATGSGGSLVLTTPEAREVRWDRRGRFRVRLDAEEVLELNLVVPPDAFVGG